MLARLLPLGGLSCPLPAEADWSRLLEIAAGSGAVATVAYNATRSADFDGLEEDLKDRLREIRIEWTARNRLMLNELARVVEILSSAGIRSVALKGAALMLAHLPEVGCRRADDMDLIVPPEALAQASERLLDAGFSVVGDTEAVSVAGTSMAEYSTGRHHAFLPLRSPRDVLIDLHWSLPNRQWFASHDFERLSNTGRTVQVDGVDVVIPNSGDLLSQLCSHVVYHHVMSPRNLARHVADVSVLGDAPDLPRPLREALAGARRRPYSVWISGVLQRAASEWHSGHSRARLWRLLFFPCAATFDRSDRLYVAGLRVERVVMDLTLRPSVYWRKLIPTRDFMAWRYDVGRAMPAHYLKRLFGRLPPVRPDGGTGTVPT